MGEPARDDDVEYFAVGPGKRHISLGPIIDVYADGAIDNACPSCGAKELEFCKHPNGTERKIPCPTRPTTSYQERG